MRPLLLRSAIAIAGLGAVLIAWVAGARSLSMLLDRLHTVEIDSRPIEQLGVEDANRGRLQVNDLPMSTATPDYGPYPMEMKVDAERQLVVEAAHHAIALGRVGESLGRGRGLGVTPGPGDKARFQIERSMLSWPTPLAINFMSGHSPSWKRHLYYRLVWEKPDGGRLEMVWRYEQYYYDNWASGFMTRAGTTGLIRVDIRP
jgi:hypothetical protein